MKVRSVEELTEFLAIDLKSRKRELSSFKFAVAAARDHEKNVLLRSGIVMLYAHFEGFVRHAGTAYLSYVKSQRLSYGELSPNFVAASLKSKLEIIGAVNKATVLTSIIESLIHKVDDIAPFEWAGEVDCRNNLTSEVLYEITCLLGISFAGYVTRRHFLDQSLLSNRNSIAHGELLQIDESEFLKAHDFVVDMLEQFRTDIENAASLQAYRRLHSKPQQLSPHSAV